MPVLAALAALKVMKMTGSEVGYKETVEGRVNRRAFREFPDHTTKQRHSHESAVSLASGASDP